MKHVSTHSACIPEDNLKFDIFYKYQFVISQKRGVQLLAGKGVFLLLCSSTHQEKENNSTQQCNGWLKN